MEDHSGRGEKEPWVGICLILKCKSLYILKRRCTNKGAKGEVSSVAEGPGKGGMAIALNPSRQISACPRVSAPILFVYGCVPERVISSGVIHIKRPGFIFTSFISLGVEGRLLQLWTMKRTSQILIHLSDMLKCCFQRYYKYAIAGLSGIKSEFKIIKCKFKSWTISFKVDHSESEFSAQGHFQMATFLKVLEIFQALPLMKTSDLGLMYKWFFSTKPTEGLNSWLVSRRESLHFRARWEPRLQTQTQTDTCMNEWFSTATLLNISVIISCDRFVCFLN